MAADSEEFICIWLQSKVEDFAAEEELAVANLQQRFLPIKVFHDVTACYNYILSLPNELIFLRLGHQWSYLVELLRGIDQLKCIYLSEHSEHGSDWRVHGVFLSVDELYSQWSKDILLFENDLTHLTSCEDRASRLETSTRSFGKEAKNIAWFQTLLKFLIEMPPPTQDTYKDTLNEARHFYRSNSTMIRKIDNFEENYKPDEVLRWYTEGSFVYQTINKALRTQNIVIIFKFRSLFRDIYYQLKKLQDQQEPLLREKKLYRGQCMASSELKQLQENVRGLVSFNTFTSTSINRDIAMLFLNPQGHDNHFRSVLFEYIIDPSISLSDLPPFADIREFSKMPEEEEVLLSPGIIARIEDYDTDKLYPQVHVFRLRLQVYHDPMLSSIQSHFLESMCESDVDESSHILRLVPILVMLGQREKIKQLIRSVPKTSNSVFEFFRSFLTLLDNMTNVFSKNNDASRFGPSGSTVKQLFDQFLIENKEVENFCPGLRAALKSLSAYIDSLLHSLSTGERSTFDMYDFADEYVRIAKQLFLSLPSMPSSTTGRSFFLCMENAMISRYSLGRDQTKWNAEEPLDDGALFEKDNEYVAFRLSAEADQAEKMGDTQKAIELNKEVLKLSNTDGKRARVLDSIADLYAKQKNWLEVISCYRDLIKLRGLPANSLKIVAALCQIGYALFSMQLYNEALKFSEYGLVLYREHHSSEHSLQDQLLLNIKCIKLAIIAQIFGVPVPPVE